MADKAPDAGTLNQKVRVLACTPMDEEKTAWEWTEVRKAWAAAEPVEGTAVFANSGVGGRKVVFTLRRQRLDPSNAIRWRERFCLLTSVAPLGPGHLTVTAALVEPVECVAVQTNTTVGPGNRPQERETMRASFPAVLTEKYSRYEREETHAGQSLTLVLVTVKDILLQAGDLVTVQGGTAAGVYNLQAAHVLDPYKNEYEIVREGDV